MTNEDTVPEESGRERVIAGRYHLLSPLGEGGMGTVWRARDEVLHREVAVKEVRAPSGMAAPDVERMYRRLEREAWAAARVSHRNVVTVHDVVMEESRPWIVMELVRGQSLADLLKVAGPLSPKRTASIGIEVLAALRSAHEAGVLHRDVKPANVLMAKDGRVVLTDFGIAVVEGSSALTMPGEVVGSPEFLAPERALGKTPGPASDLWSLGVLLYAAVEGTSPFRNSTPLSTLRAIVDVELPPPSQAGALAPVIEGLLRKDPEERLGAEQAEQGLRLVGEGTSLHTATAAQDSLSATALADSATQVSATDAATQVSATDAATQVSATDAATQVSPPDSVTQAAVADPAPEPAAEPSAATAVTQTADTHPAAPTTATQTADTHPTAPAATAAQAPDPGPVAAAAPASPPSPASPRRKRRTTFVAAGATLLALVLTGAGFGLHALISDGDGGRQDAGGSAAGAGALSVASGGGARDSIQVGVNVTGSRTTYAGPCPSPNEQAPTFTATFSVDRIPAQLSYRWVTADGDLIAGGWRTLAFPEGGDDVEQETVRLTTWARGGTFESGIGVELKAPLQGKSNFVPVSLTCETGTGEGTSSGQ
ncbi:serine/threonine-protein kinase [Streptomyces sp. TS71-3]|uniref:serine/threonine-protein kinase n=1 Tax=Streptomyces sp. TS71-3 TaxID=2733862 RepID=UPI001B0927A7|nr:serine/threonine-protein kinase [Streptomyces sp. TS71-3]GHJ37349.1 hypothetical protein Sm713_29580 [Streptomyces sp. TS71-3]